MRSKTGVKPTPVDELKPRIVVIGVGGAGGNAVDSMIDAKLSGVEFIVANTDSQALSRSEAQVRIQLGERITRGLGAGAKPEVGAEAAEDAHDEIRACFEGAQMVFVTAGLGGGTGTGAAPVIARIARDMGLLTVAVVTKPFTYEGVRRMEMAEAGLEKLREVADTLIVVPNQNLFRLADEHTSVSDAFAMADNVLHAAVRGVADLITQPSYVNLDFADVRAVLHKSGAAMMGVGEASGADRARGAARAAVINTLLDDVSLSGAKSVLINVTGSSKLTLYEMDQAANEIRAEVDPNAHIIVGSAFDDEMGDMLRVAVLATGMTERDSSSYVSDSIVVQQRGEDRDDVSGEGQRVEPQDFDEENDDGGSRKKRKRRGLFGWGRRKDKDGDVRPQHAANEPAEVDEAFDDEDIDQLDEDELEIPTFLRRKAS